VSIAAAQHDLLSSQLGGFHRGFLHVSERSHTENASIPHMRGLGATCMNAQAVHQVDLLVPDIEVIECDVGMNKWQGLSPKFVRACATSRASRQAMFQFRQIGVDKPTRYPPI
jgi:hypothetical protein